MLYFTLRLNVLNFCKMGLDKVNNTVNYLPLNVKCFTTQTSLLPVMQLFIKLSLFFRLSQSPPIDETQK